LGAHEALLEEVRLGLLQGIGNRLFASFYDLIAVRWMKKRMFRYKVSDSVN